MNIPKVLTSKYVIGGTVGFAVACALTEFPIAAAVWGLYAVVAWAGRQVQQQKDKQ